MKAKILVKSLQIMFYMLLLTSAVLAGAPFKIGEGLPAWQPGDLDIYHFNTGAGNATFMIFPDSTTLLYDLGDVASQKYDTKPPKYATLMPNNSKHAYEWIAAYIKELSPHPDVLNYLVLSHYHFDHMGEWDGTLPEQARAHYKLTGITGLAEFIHIQVLIDRSYPDYQFHGDFPNPINSYLQSDNEYGKKTAYTMQNYQNFIQYQMQQNHMKVEKFQVGSHSQIQLVYKPYTHFSVYNIIGDGDVWTGKGDGRYHFISYAENDQNNTKIENDLSNGMRIDYGSFRYFTGGDITGRALSGNDVDTSAEAAAAPVIGKVDVATLDHHGFDDAQSNILVKTLRPSIWVQQNWAASQTSLPLLLRIFNNQNYSYERDLFALEHFKLNDLAIPTLGDPSSSNSSQQYYKSQTGHVVIRVLPDGKTFWVIVLNDASADLTVKAFYGPYTTSDK